MENGMRQKLINWKQKGNQAICKLITPKTLAILLTIGYIVSLIPLLWIARFNYPSADDYTNGSRCYHVWQESHSLLKVLAEAMSRTGDEWMTWRGCFTSSFLSALPPNIFGEKMYGITAWIVLSMLSLATMFFFYEVLVKGLGADRYTSHSVSMITLFIAIQCMGVSGRAESFYWYSGAINYTFIHALSLFLYGMLISIAHSVGKKKCISLVLSSVLGLLVAGGNQMTMLNGVIVLFVVAGFLTILKKWKNYKGIWIPIVSFYIGVIISVVAPGNFMRASASSGMNPVKAILVSFYYCLDLMVNQWTTWSIMVLVICLVPLFWYMAGSVKFKFPYPFWVVVFGYCLVSAMVTPPLFIMGNIEAGRLQGLMFLMYVLVLVLCVGYVTGWVRQKYECKSPKRENYYGICGVQCIVGCGLLFLMGSLISIIPEPHYYTFSSAANDLLDGSAAIYGRELEERSELYRNGEKGTLLVNDLSTQPKLLFFSDIDKDPGDWKNQGICRYYDLEALKLVEKSTENNE